MISALKGPLLAAIAAVVGLSLTNAASAALVLVGATPESAFLEVRAQGFGAAPGLLALRSSSVESGTHGGAVRSADKSSTPVGPVFSATAPIDFKATELGLQKAEVFDFALTKHTGFNGILAISGSSGLFAGLSTLGCASSAPTTCEPSDPGPDSLLGFARSTIATPFTGAIFLFSSVLLGGLGMSTRRARHRNRGAVSLLA